MLLAMSFQKKLKSGNYSSLKISEMTSDDLDDVLILLDSLKENKDVTSLNLSDNPFVMYNSKISDALAKLKHLTSLNLSGNSIGIDGINVLRQLFSALANLTNLKFLDLSGNSIGKDAPEVIKTLYTLENLQSLNLRDNLLCTHGKAVVEALAGFPNLKFLDLSKNFFGRDGLKIAEALANLTNLKFLDLSDDYFGVHSRSVAKALAECKKLHTIIFGNADLNNNIDIEYISAVIESGDRIHIASIFKHNPYIFSVHTEQTKALINNELKEVKGEGAAASAADPHHDMLVLEELPLAGATASVTDA